MRKDAELIIELVYDVASSWETSTEIFPNGCDKDRVAAILIGLSAFLIAGFKNDYDLCQDLTPAYQKRIMNHVSRSEYNKYTALMNDAYLSFRGIGMSVQYKGEDWMERMFQMFGQNLVKLLYISDSDNEAKELGEFSKDLCEALIKEKYKRIESVDSNNANVKKEKKNYLEHMGWYKFNIYWRIPFGIVMSFIGSIYYFTQDYIGLAISNAIIGVVSGALYYLMLQKDKKSYYAMLVEIALQGIIFANNSFKNYSVSDDITLIGFLILFVVFFIIWTLPNYIYYKHRKAYWIHNEYQYIDRIYKEGDDSKSIEYCPYCREKIREGYLYCNICGKSLADYINKNVSENDPVITPTENNDVDNVQIFKKSPDDEAFEEIRKWKSLLDEGVITDEEFRMKKEELLYL